MAREPPEIQQAPIGAFRALAWFFENSKDAFLAIRGEKVRRSNPVWSRLTGFDPQASAGALLWDFIVPEDLGAVQPAVRALKHEDEFGCELRLKTQSGSELWARCDFVGGEEGWVLAIMRDITAERRLRESETRFRALTTATADVVYRMSPDWREMRALDGRGFIADTETPSIAWIDQYLLPEDQGAILAVIEDAVARRDVFQLEHRVRRVDGAVGWTFSRAVPIEDEAGEVVEWFGAASDVTERRRAQDHLRLVVHELNHRVKNNLAMIHAAASQTFRTARTVEEARASLMGRLSALAHANNLLAGDARVGRTLKAIIEEAVRPHCNDAGRCVIEGPDVEIAPRNAHTLSLAMHELATNAVKHGAWSAARGRVGVRWSAARSRSGRQLHLEWREAGGPLVTPPGRRGFGSRLVERGLAGEFGGSVELRFEPTGLVCVLDAPLAA